ncbi:MAG: GldG family protein [Alphaproteobacteria bacterium]
MGRALAMTLLLAGFALLIAALVIQAVLLEPLGWVIALGVAGVILAAVGGFGVRDELGGAIRGRRGEIALFTLGVIGILVVLGYFSVRYPLRYDMTSTGRHSLSEQTVTMLQRLEKPVQVTFFHDPKMRETVELYQLMAGETDKLTVAFHDPMLNPAEARLQGVQFAGTAVMSSEDRKLQVHGQTETDIANGILRVSQGAKQVVCFVDGHDEADPFSTEGHDHVEGMAGPDGHSHGMGTQYVLHERHGIAKARHSLETLNYAVEKILLTKRANRLNECGVLVVAGPKIPLLPAELDAIDRYLAAGGNALFMLEPFVDTGLEPILSEYGIVLDDTIVIDDASHYWADPSAPAVTSYNHHQVARDLPLTFFPGVRSLSPTTERMAGTSVVPIANSSSNSFGETSRDSAAFDEGKDSAGPLTLVAVANRRPTTEADLRISDLGPRVGQPDFTLASSRENAPEVTGKSRITVIGDVDFATNSFFHFLGNGNLFLNAINYLAAQENLIGLEPRTYDLPRLSVTNRQIKATFVLSVMFLPALLAMIGVAVWWRQR